MVVNCLLIIGVNFMGLKECQIWLMVGYDSLLFCFADNLFRFIHQRNPYLDLNLRSLILSLPWVALSIVALDCLLSGHSWRLWLFNRVNLARLGCICLLSIFQHLYLLVSPNLDTNFFFFDGLSFHYFLNYFPILLFDLLGERFSLILAYSLSLTLNRLLFQLAVNTFGPISLGRIISVGLYDTLAYFLFVGGLNLGRHVVHCFKLGKLVFLLLLFWHFSIVFTHLFNL